MQGSFSIEITHTQWRGKNYHITRSGASSRFTLNDDCKLLTDDAVIPIYDCLLVQYARCHLAKFLSIFRIMVWERNSVSLGTNLLKAIFPAASLFDAIREIFLNRNN